MFLPHSQNQPKILTTATSSQHPGCPCDMNSSHSGQVWLIETFSYPLTPHSTVAENWVAERQTASRNSVPCHQYMATTTSSGPGRTGVHHLAVRWDPQVLCARSTSVYLAPWSLPLWPPSNSWACASICLFALRSISQSFLSSPLYWSYFRLPYCLAFC